MLILHDDPTRKFAYGPAHGLPDTNIGRFLQDVPKKPPSKAGLLLR
jgi:hypothetical protein